MICDKIISAYAMEKKNCPKIEQSYAHLSLTADIQIVIIYRKLSKNNHVIIAGAVNQFSTSPPVKIIETYILCIMNMMRKFMTIFELILNETGHFIHVFNTG